MKLKIILFFLAALLAIIIFKMIFIGVFIFIKVVKYIVIAALIAYAAYWVSEKLKKMNNHMVIHFLFCIFAKN
jgi:predicted PurR-regulated permease PerM